MDVCTAWGPQGPDCLALAMELQPGAPDAAAAEAAIESPGSRGVPRVGHGWLDMNMSRMVDRYLGRPGARTRRAPVLPGRSSLPWAMLFRADPVRAATDHVLSRYGPRRADARSRACAGEKLLPAITSTGERFVESGNDHASDTEVLVIALLVILFEPSPNETQERAALARRAHVTCRAGQLGDGGGARRLRPLLGSWPSFPSGFARAPTFPLTAAPHGVGCEVTRGDPGGGGGALSRRSSGRSSRYSFVFLGASTPRPPTSRQQHPLGDALIFSPLHRPPFRRACFACQRLL